MTVVTLLAASGFHGEDAALIVVIAVLLAASGVLAMAETSLVRMNRIKAKSLVDEKKPRARDSWPGWSRTRPTSSTRSCCSC